MLLTRGRSFVNSSEELLNEMSVFVSFILSEIANQFPVSVVPRSRFLGDTGVPLPEFQGDIYKFWGTDQIYQIFTC